MNFKTIVKVAPTSEPITRDEARQQLRIDFGFDEEQIGVLIPIARDKAEKFCNRFFTQQTVLIVFDSGFDGSVLKLPFPDLNAINSLKYFDSDGMEITIDQGEYRFESDIQEIYLTSHPTDAVKILVEVVTGPPVEYGGAKAAMLMFLTDLYETRSESVKGVSIANNPAVINSLYPYRVNIGV